MSDLDKFFDRWATTLVVASAIFYLLGAIGFAWIIFHFIQKYW